MEKLFTLHFTIANVTPEVLVAEFAELFGGCTATPTLGSWLNPETKKIEVEPGTRVTLTVPENQEVTAEARRVINKVLAWAQDRGEKAVFVEGGTAAEIMNTNEEVS